MQKHSCHIGLLVLIVLAAETVHACAQSTSTPSDQTLQRTLASLNEDYSRQGPVSFHVHLYSATHGEVVQDHDIIQNQATSSPVSECLLTFPADIEDWYLPLDLRKTDPQGFALQAITARIGSTNTDPHAEHVTPADILLVVGPPNPKARLDTNYLPVLGFFTDRAIALRVLEDYRHAAQICHDSARLQVPMPPPPPSAGPTMEQTLSFINQAIVEHGTPDDSYGPDFHAQVAQYESCVLSSRTSPSYPSQHIRLYNLDPRTVDVQEHPTGNFEVQLHPPHHFFYILGDFRDRDTAKHVAKAFIHALSLCYKPEAAPLF